jgi:hypothetical protein
VWDNTAGTYVERPTSGEGGIPKWFHRAVTNHFSVKTDGIASILNQSQPAKNWYATKDDDEPRGRRRLRDRGPGAARRDRLPAQPAAAAEQARRADQPRGASSSPTTTTRSGAWTRSPILQCANCQQFVHPMDAPNEEDMCPDCGGSSTGRTHPQTGMPLGVAVSEGQALHAEFLSELRGVAAEERRVAHEDHLPWVCTHQRWSTEDAISRWPKLKALLDSRSTLKTGEREVDAPVLRRPDARPLRRSTTRRVDAERAGAGMRAERRRRVPTLALRAGHLAPVA